jgi:hypothetical protein
MYNCTEITDAGLAHLTGIHTLGLRGCARVTDVGLLHLRGIHALTIEGLKLIRGDCVAQLEAGGLRAFHVVSGSASTLAACRAFRFRRATGRPARPQRAERGKQGP